MKINHNKRQNDLVSFFYRCTGMAKQANKKTNKPNDKAK